MLLAIDAGNTNIVFALFDGLELKGQWRRDSRQPQSHDDLAVWLAQAFALSGFGLDLVDEAIIANVVPEFEHALITLASHNLNVPSRMVGRDALDFGFENRAARPHDVGADRLVNGVAGQAFYGKPLVVVDFGTATSFDFFCSNGDFIGGIIAPGVHLSRDGLAHAAARLPHVDITRTEQLIGRDTRSAMQSGLYWGYVAMIQGLLDRALRESELSGVHIVATGGLGEVFISALPELKAFDPNLTVKGLALLHARS
ncbi:MAG: type III pantothenate kinase [Pseudomonadota bacterium]